MKGVIPRRRKKGSGDDDNNQNIHASMARISGNGKSSSIYVGLNYTLTNLILDLEATCNMTHQVSCFIPGSL